MNHLQSLETLNLSNNNLIKIPTSIGDLKNLFRLDLMKNKINEIPFTIWENLVNLNNLNLNFNEIKLIPISFCKNLQFLEISFNFIDKIPEEIGNLNSLHLLNISHNNLTSIPNSISKLKQLKRLYLSYNNFSEFIWPNEFQNLKKLKEFICVGCKLNKIPKFLFSISSISNLDLSGNNLNKISSKIQNIENLERLIFSHNQITLIPSEISELLLLSEIDFSFNKLKELPSQLNELELLIDLDFSSNLLEEIPDLSNLSRLLQLKISHNKIQNFPIVNSNCWVSLEGNEFIRIEESKHCKEFTNLFPFLLKKQNKTQFIKLFDEYFTNNEICFDFSWSELRGRRNEQQDSISVLRNIENRNLHFLGVYDGHGGTFTSEILASFLHSIIFDKLNEYFDNFDKKNILLSMNNLFKDSFEFLQNELQNFNVSDGSTANVCFILNNIIFCANTGDSRSIIIRGNNAIPLSFDHKPENFDERNRIEENGGFVDAESKRVNNILALSRAFGDCDLYPAITCHPDVIAHEITPEDCFLIMACDGVWDVLSNDEVAKLVCNCKTAGEAAILLRDAAFVAGTTDNISVLVAKISY